MVPFPASFAQVTVTVDESGVPWLHAPALQGAGPRKVGLSSGNLLAADSDPELGLQLMEGRVSYELSAKGHRRESLRDLEQDWSLLEQARKRWEERGAWAGFDNCCRSAVRASSWCA